MTLAQQYHQEGKQESREEGIKAGELKGLEEERTFSRRQSLLEALELRFGPVPARLLETIAGIADPDKLRALPRAAIVSDSLAACTSTL